MYCLKGQLNTIVSPFTCLFGCVEKAGHFCKRIDILVLGCSKDGWRNPLDNSICSDSCTLLLLLSRVSLDALSKLVIFAKELTFWSSVQQMDSAIHWIILCAADNAFGFVNVYSLESDLSG